MTWQAPNQSAATAAQTGGWPPAAVSPPQIRERLTRTTGGRLDWTDGWVCVFVHVVPQRFP